MDDTLIKQVALGTGLSEEKIKEVIDKWILQTGRSPQNISSEDFREVLVELVQNLFSEVAAGDNKFIQTCR